MERLTVNRNNCKVTLTSRKKVSMLGNTQTDSQTDLFVLKPWPSLHDNNHVSYLTFVSFGFFVHKMKKIIVTLSELFGKE